VGSLEILFRVWVELSVVFFVVAVPELAMMVELHSVFKFEASIEFVVWVEVSVVFLEGASIAAWSTVSAVC